MQVCGLRGSWRSLVGAAVILSAAFMGSVSEPLRAQQEGGATLAGTILDSAGKTVEGATVTVKNDAASLSRTVDSDASGAFSVAGLPAGSYNVEATAPGFARSFHLG